ncbi:phage recombination protein Bet [Peptoniphilus olsenii]|uniref:Phage recombination protein Bet n=1 Tax=Peptoniphilus olsenii TaxID=411570 RepID=A0ABV2J769_9FIRM
MTNAIVKYETSSGEVALDKQTIKNYLVSGDANKVTDQELELFLNLCKYQKLNPFLRDAYLVKFGNSPANIITGKDFFIKRAYANKNFKTYTAGIIVLDKEGNINERAGSFYAKQVETLVGAWCRITRTDGSEFYHTVSFDEYNTGQSTWKKIPATMIRKVALVQALREAFPEDYQGLYDNSEMGVNEEIISDEKVEVKKNTVTQEQFDQLLKAVGENRIVEFCKERGYKDACKITIDEYLQLMSELDITDAEVVEDEDEVHSQDESFKDLEDIDEEDLPF